MKQFGKELLQAWSPQSRDAPANGFCREYTREATADCAEGCADHGASPGRAVICGVTKFSGQEELQGPKEK